MTTAWECKNKVLLGTPRDMRESDGMKEKWAHDNVVINKSKSNISMNMNHLLCTWQPILLRILIDTHHSS